MKKQSDTTYSPALVWQWGALLRFLLLLLFISANHCQEDSLMQLDSREAEGVVIEVGRVADIISHNNEVTVDGSLLLIPADDAETGMEYGHFKSDDSSADVSHLLDATLPINDNSRDSSHTHQPQLIPIDDITQKLSHSASHMENDLQYEEVVLPATLPSLIVTDHNNNNDNNNDIDIEMEIDMHGSVSISVEHESIFHEPIRECLDNNSNNESNSNSNSDSDSSSMQGIETSSSSPAKQQEQEEVESDSLISATVIYTDTAEVSTITVEHPHGEQGQEDKHEHASTISPTYKETSIPLDSSALDDTATDSNVSSSNNTKIKINTIAQIITNNSNNIGNSNNSPEETSSGSGIVRSVLSSSIDYRLLRLTALVEERKDLIEDYNKKQLDDETILNSLNSHIMKAMQHRSLVPHSDQRCTWNYLKERCEPPCECTWQYKFGDLHPGRSCRLNHAYTNKVKGEDKSEYQGEGDHGSVREIEIEIEDRDQDLDQDTSDRDSDNGIGRVSGSGSGSAADKYEYEHYQIESGDVSGRSGRGSGRGSAVCDPTVLYPGPIKIAIQGIASTVKFLIDCISKKINFKETSVEGGGDQQIAN